MVGKNPFIGATLPKHEAKRRDIWDAKTIREALDACGDGKLFIAINLAFACSLRFGEICGWRRFWRGWTSRQSRYRAEVKTRLVLKNPKTESSWARFGFPQPWPIC